MKVDTKFSPSAEVTRMLSHYSKFRPAEKENNSSEHESKTKKENKSKTVEKKPDMAL